MKKISIFFAVLFMFASYAEAQSSADSVSIRGRILLDFDDIDVPEPFSGAELFIMDKDSHRSLERAITNSFGEFTFLMPKGEYYIGLYGVQYYKDYWLFPEKDFTCIKPQYPFRKVDARTNVTLDEWTLVVKRYIQLPFWFGPNSEMQKMKIDGVKVTVH
jgi:hypothetical protein